MDSTRAGRALRSKKNARRQRLPVRQWSLERLEERSLLAVISWDGGAPVGNNWNDPANWSTNTVPGAADTAVINFAGTFTVTFSANSTVGGLVLGGSSAGIKTLDVGARTLTINGGASVEPNGILSLSGGILAGTDVLKNDGVIVSQTNASTINKQIANNGTINVSQNLTLNGPVASDSGTLNISATRTLTFQGSSLDLSGRTLVGSGTLEIARETALNLSSDLTLASNTTPILFSGSVTVNGPGALLNQTTLVLASDAINSGLVNQGTIRVDSSSTINGTFVAEPGSLLRDNSVLTIANGFTNEGTIEFGGGSLTFNVNSGTLINPPTGVIRSLSTTLASVNARIDNRGTIDVDQNMTVTGGTPFVSNTGTIDLAAGKTLTVNSATVNLSAATLTGTGTFNVGSNATLNVTGDLKLLSPGPQLLLGGSVTVNGPGTLTNRSTLALFGDTINASLTNEGTIVALVGNAGSAINGAFSTDSTSIIRVEGNGFANENAVLTIANGFTNNGRIELTSINSASTNARLNVTTGTLTNAATGSIVSLAGTGGGRTLNAQVTNQGTLTVSQPLSVTNASRTFISTTGTIQVDMGDVLSINSGTSILGSGSVLIGTGQIELGPAFLPHRLSLASDLTLATGKPTLNLSGIVTIEGPGALTNQGTLQLSTDTINTALRNQGTLVVAAGTGSVINGPLSTIPASTIRVQGSGAINESGVLTVANGFTNNGLIELTSIGGVGQSAILNVTNGTLTNAAIGRIESQSGAGGGRTINAQLTNLGALAVSQSLSITNTSRTFTSTTGGIQVDTGDVLTINGGATVLGSGSVLIGAGQIDLASTPHSLNLASDLTLTTSKPTLTLSGAVTINGPGVLVNQATLQFSGDTINTALNNQGTLVALAGAGSAINGALSTNTASIIRVQGSGASNQSAILTVANGFTNNGLIELTSISFPGQNATMNVTAGTLTNAAATGRIHALTGAGGSRTLNAQVNNQGTIVLADGPLSISGSLTNAATGTLQGTGSISVGGSGLFNAGIVRPGGPIGAISLTGNYVQAASGRLEIDFGGSPQEPEFDQFVVIGPASLGGTLAAVVAPTFNFSSGEPMEVMRYSSASFDFTNFEGLVAGNRRFRPSKEATRYLLISEGNSSPQANPDTATTVAGQPTPPIFILANDTDPDLGDTLSLVNFGQGSNGVVTQVAPGQLVYTPNPSFIGNDSFTYTIQDQGGLFAVGVVLVTVTPGQGGNIGDLDDLLNNGINTLFDRLPAFSERFNQPHPQLPLVSDDLADLFALDNATSALSRPQVAQSDFAAELINALATVGIVVDCIQGGHGAVAACTNPQDRIQVHFGRQAGGLSGSAEVDNSITSALADLVPGAVLEGELDWQAALDLTFNLGVDTSGFYMLGATGLDLNLSGGGSVNGTFPLVGDLSIDAIGSATIPSPGLSVRLGGETNDRRYRIAEMTADLWRPSVNGDANLGLDLNLSPIDLTWHGDWLISFVNNVVTVTANVGFPCTDEFLRAMLDGMSVGLDQFFGDGLLGVLNGLDLPMADDQGPRPADSPTSELATTGDNPNWFEQFVNGIKSIFAWDVVPNGAGGFKQAGTGLRYSVGDALLGGPQLRQRIRSEINSNLKGGEGIRIGVISDGAIGHRHATCRDVTQVGKSCYPEITPDRLNVSTAFPGGRLNGVGTGAEGVAMMEIIHDIAPMATLYFVGIGDPSSSDNVVNATAFKAGVDWFLGNEIRRTDANGTVHIDAPIGRPVDIIVEDIAIRDRSFFNDDDLSAKVAQAVASNVLFISAAGNDNGLHYQAPLNLVTLSPADRPVSDDPVNRPLGHITDFHQFENRLPYLDIIIPAGKTLQHGLQWSDSYADPRFNLVLILTDDQGDVLPEKLADTTIDRHPKFKATAPTDPTAPNGDPLLIFENSGTADIDIRVYVGVENIPPAAPGLQLADVVIEMFSNRAFALNTPTDTVFGQPTVPGVMTVAAISTDDRGFDDPNDASSRGPSTHYDPLTNIFSRRNVLDVSGIDDVSVTGFNGFGTARTDEKGKVRVVFGGTSAAAPHVAGIAALLKAYRPVAVPDDLFNSLRHTTVDLSLKPEAAKDIFQVTTGFVNIPLNVVANDVDPDKIYLDSLGSGVTRAPLKLVSVARTSQTLVGAQIVVDGQIVRYTPPAGSGVMFDEFQYTIEDDDGDTTTGIAQVQVAAGGLPVAVPETFFVMPGLPIAVQPLLNDLNAAGAVLTNIIPDLHGVQAVTMSTSSNQVFLDPDQIIPVFPDKATDLLRLQAFYQAERPDGQTFGGLITFVVWHEGSLRPLIDAAADPNDPLLSEEDFLLLRGYDHASGFGRLDGNAAGDYLAQRYQLPVVSPPPSSSPDPDAFSFVEALESAGFTIEAMLSCSQIADLLSGRNSNVGDLLRIGINSANLNPATLPEFTADFGLDVEEISALDATDVGGRLHASLSPRFDLGLGLDLDGFYVRPTSSVGGRITAAVEGAGTFAGFDATVSGDIAATANLGFVDADANEDGKLRPAELAQNITALDISLAEVTADAKIDLTLLGLDYVPVDGDPTNNTANGGDPFRFAATTSMQFVPATDTTPFQFLWDEIDLLNPNVDQPNDFTLDRFIQNVLLLAQDAINGQEFAFLDDLRQAFGDDDAPLTDNPLDDALGVVEKLAQAIAQNTRVCSSIDFDFIEGLLNNGLPATATDLIRVQLDTDLLTLTPLNSPSEDFSQLLTGPGATGTVAIQNASVSGSFAFGLDTSANPFYLLTAADAQTPNCATSISGGFDVVANVSGTLAGGVLDIDNATARLSPSFDVDFSQVAGGKFRLGDDPAEFENVEINLSNANNLAIAADGASLLLVAPGVVAAVSDDNLAAGPRGLEGNFDLADGSFSLAARQFNMSVEGVVHVATTAAGATPAVTLTHDPAAPPTADLLRITQATATIPALVTADGKPSVTLSNFGLRQNGDLFVGNASVNLPPSYTDGFGVGDALPLEIHNLCVSFPSGGDDRVRILARGEFNLDSLESLLPTGTQLEAQIGDGTLGAVTCGAQPSGQTDDPFELELDLTSLEDGLVRPVNFGPITLEITGLNVGGVTLSGSVTMGGYQNGQFDDTIGGSLTIVAGESVNSVLTVKPLTSSLLLDVPCAEPVPGELVPGATGLCSALVIDAVASANPSGGSSGVSLDFGLMIVTRPKNTAPFIEFVAVRPTFDSFAITNFEINIGNFVRLTAGLVEITPNPAPNDPFATLRNVAITFPALPEMNTGATISSILLFDDPDVGGDARAVIGSFTFNISGELGANPTLLDVTGLQLVMTDLVINVDDQTVAAGSIKLHADTAVVLPAANGGQGLFSVAPLDAVFANGALTVTTGAFQFGVSDLVTVEGAGLAMQIPLVPNQPASSRVLSFAEIGARIDALESDGLAPTILLEDFLIRGDGTFGLTRAVVTLPTNGDMSDQQDDYAFPLAELLPFVVTSLEFDFDPDDNGVANFDNFLITVDGQFNIGLLQSLLGFTPVIKIGEANQIGDVGCNVAVPGNGGLNDVVISVDSLRNGRIGLASAGPFTLGIAGWDVGPFTFCGQVRLGRYDAAGNLQSLASADEDVAGFVKLQKKTGGLAQPLQGSPDFSDFDNPPASLTNANFQFDGVQIDFAGDFQRTAAETSLVLDLATSIDIGFKLGEFLELYGVNLDTTITFSTPNNTFDPDVDFALNSVGVDAVKIGLPGLMSMTALGATFFFRSDQLHDPHSDDDTERAVMAHFDEIGVSFDLVGLVSLGGTLTNLDILHNGLPDFEHVTGFSLDGPDGLLGDLLDWIPVTIDEFKMEFLPGFFPAAGGIDLAKSRLIVSGSISPSTDSDAPWPISGGFNGLCVNLDKLSKGDFPVECLGGVHVGFDATELLAGTGFTVKGKLGFGSVEHNGDSIVYARVGGEFGFADFSAGVDLIISERGPLLASVIAPLGIPLDPAGMILLSKVTGSLFFGGKELRSVTDPQELVTDPLFFDVLTFDDQDIARELRNIIDCGAGSADPCFTWDLPLTIGLKGEITTVATAAMFESVGEVTLAANVVFDGPNQGLRFLGTGVIKAWQFPLGRAGMLLDFSNPLAPELNLAVQAPPPPDLSNPLGFFLPARGLFTLRLDTDGMIEAPLVGLQTFVTELGDNLATSIATRLEADHSRPLAQCLLDNTAPFGLDRDGDTVIRGKELCAPSVAEAAQTIDGPFLKARLSEVLPDDFSPAAFASLDVERAARFAQGFIGELAAVQGEVQQAFDMLLSDAPDSQKRELLDQLATQGLQLAQDFLDAVLNATVSAGVAAFNRFNPSLIIHGFVQPVIFNIPLGEPTEEVDVIISKDAISFAYAADLKELFVKRPFSMLTGGFAPALIDLLTLGFEIRGTLGFTLDLPDELVCLFLTGISPSTGNSNLADICSGTLPDLEPADRLSRDLALADALASVINPFGNWEVLVQAEMKILGFEYADVSGMLFPPQVTRSEPKEFEPRGLFAQKVFVDGNEDGQFDADEDPSSITCQLPDRPPQVVPINPLAALAEIPVSKRPANADPEDREHYCDMLTHGGLLLTGQLKLPKILIDPVDLLTNDLPALPNIQLNTLEQAGQTFENVNTYVTDLIDALTQASEIGRMQIYLPSPASLFDVSNLLDYDTENGGPAETLQNRIDDPAGDEQPFDPAVRFDPNRHPASALLFADLNGNSIYDQRIDVLIDRAANRTWAETDPAIFAFTIDADELIDLDPSSSSQTPNVTGVRYFVLNDVFDDAGNGEYDGARSFIDANQNGRLDNGEEITELSEGFVDVLRNGVRNGRYDHGIDTLIDANGDGLPTGELFIDANGNGQYDGPEPFKDADDDDEVDSREYQDLNGNGQFDAVGEVFIDLGNAAFDPGGDKIRVRPRTLGDSAETALDVLIDLFESAFLEGFVDAKLLSIQLGRATVSANSTGLQFTSQVPLMGLTVTVGVGFNSINATEMLASLLDNPIVVGVLGESSSAVKDYLAGRNPNHAAPVINIPFPVASYELSAQVVAASPGDNQTSRQQIADLLGDSLGIPGSDVIADILAPSGDPAGASLFIGFYTPGFELDAPHPLIDAFDNDTLAGDLARSRIENLKPLDDVKRYGGIRLDVQLNVPRLIEDARFFFESELVPTSLSGLFLKDFTALAKVDKLAIPDLAEGAQNALFRASMLAFLTKESDRIDLILAGGVSLLNDSLVVDASLAGAIDFRVANCNENPGGACHPGVFGEMALTARLGDEPTLADDQFSIVGEFIAQFNTTDIPQPLLHGTIPGQSGRIHVEGHIEVFGYTVLDNAVLDVQLTTAPGEVAFQAIASGELNLGPFGSVDLNNAFIRLDSSGIAVDIDLEINELEFAVLGITLLEIDGNFRLQLNTSENQITYETCNINGANCVEHTLDPMILNLEVFGDDDRDDDTDPDGATATLLGVVTGELSLSMRLSRDEIAAAGAVSLKYPSDKPDDEADVFLGGAGSLRITDDFFEAQATGTGRLFGVEGSVAVTVDRFQCLRSDVNGVDIQHIGLDDDTDNECKPHLYVDPLRVNERDSGQKTRDFGVFLTEPYIPGLFDQEPFIVTYDVILSGSDPVEFGSASNRDPDDPNPDVVTLSSGEFTFSKDTAAYPFPLEEFISFSVLGDTFPENDETFKIVITGIRDVDDEEGNRGAAIPSDKIVIASSFDEGTVTVLDDDTRLPGPVSVTVRRTGSNRGRTTPGTPSRSESQDTLIVRATGLLPGDSTRVEVRRNVGGTIETRTVTLTEDNPFRTVSFDDCVFERNELATYSAVILDPADDATITLPPLVDVPDTQIINDDSERPCGSLVFYNFETPSFLPAPQQFQFTSEPTFVAEAPIVVITETTFDDRAEWVATPFRHATLLKPGVGVFKDDPGQPERADSLAAASDRWSPTPSPKFFQFRVELTNTVFDPLGDPPSPLRYNVTGFDFWDRVADGGPKKWELRSSQDNFRSVLATGSTHPGEFGHNVNVPIRELGCLDGDTQFRLFGLDGASKDWEVDNVALIGHFGGVCFPPPHAPNVTIIVPEDSGEQVVDLSDHVTDPDGDVVTIVPPVLRFTPPANVCNFSTSQSYSATDSRGQTSFGTVIFTVSCVNDPPVANDFTVNRNPFPVTGVPAASVDLLAHVSDVDGNIAAVVPIGTGNFGFLTPDGAGRFNYVRFPNRPDIDDVVPYQVIDSQGLVDIGFVTIHVNQRPVATNQTITVTQCVFAEIDLRTFVSDETDDDLLIYAITLPQGGLAGDLNSLAIPQLFYEPRETPGKDTFKYKVTDEDGRMSIERTVTLDVTVDCGPIPPIDFDDPLEGGGSFVNGYVSGATIFFDANRNGRQDFLDIDGDGSRDANEPLEPAFTTAADGGFKFSLPEAFDRAGDGRIDAADGRWVATGGVITSTLRPSDTIMTAPGNATVITPITTLIDSLMEEEGLSVSDAHARVQRAFGLEGVNLLETDHIARTLAGDAVAPIIAAANVQLTDAAAQVAALLSGATGQPASQTAAAVYDALAHSLAAPEATLDLSDIESLKSAISEAATDLGATLATETTSAAAATIAAANQRIGEIPLTSDLGYLISLYQVESVAQGDTADDLVRLGAGQIEPDELVADHTGSALDAALASATRGNIVPSALSIGDVSVFEGDAGSTRLTFRVATPVPSVLPITVDFETADGTARAGLGDYVGAAGTLTFAPGETEKFVTVDVAANNLFEQHKTFFVVLSDVQGAVVADAKATGTILNDDEPVFTAGDIDKDGSVALSDLASLQNDLGKITDPGDPADLNGDGRVTRGDLAALMRNYGRSFDTDEPADIDRGGTIGLSDLFMAQEIWGANVEPGHPADLNGDLRIDRPDIIAILRNFGDSVAPSPAPSAAPQSPAAVIARTAHVGPSPASDRLRTNPARTRIDRAHDTLAAATPSTAVRLRATRQNVSARAIDEIFGNG